MPRPFEGELQVEMRLLVLQFLETWMELWFVARCPAVWQTLTDSCVVLIRFNAVEQQR